MYANKYSDQQENDFNNSIQLDSEFDQHLANMKKYILLLSDKQAKQNCAMWIKKLCEISDNPNLSTKQIRNSHSFSLLRNLQTSQYLSYPFNDKPPNGELRYLHTPDGYHSSTKSNGSHHNSTQNSSQVQDIKRLNLESGTSSSSSNDSANFKNDRKSVFDERDYNSSYSESTENGDDEREDRKIHDQTTSQKMMDFLNNNKSNLSNSPNHAANINNSINTSNMNNMNNKYRRREKSMPNILNQNMSFPRQREQMFSQQNTRNTDYNHMADNSDLQNFIMNVNQQNETQRMNLEKQKNFQIHQLEFQIKRLESKFQEDKMDLQHQHNLEIQRIMDRKNHELEKVKKEHRNKVKDNEDLISNLERKVNSLAKQVAGTQMESDKRLNEITGETQKILEMHQQESDKKFKDLFYKSEKEKSELQKQHTQAFQVLVEETNARLRKVEGEYNDQQVITDNVVKELEARTELLKKEMERNLNMIDSLECEKKEMREEYEKLEKEFAESKKKAQANLSKLKEAHTQDIDNLKGKMDNKIQEIRFECQKTIEKELKLMNEIEKNKALLEKKNQKMVNLLREKDYHIESLKENIQKQEIQAENALNEIRDQVEQNSKKIYDEMEEQMNKCESDLAQSKLIADKHAKEFHKEMEKIKNKHDKEIHKLKNEFNSREQCLKQELDEERKNIMRHNNESLAAIHDKNIEHNFKYQNRIESLTNTICQQDLQIAELQREVADANSLRKNQIIELGILREDEKIKLIKEKDLEIEQLKMEAEVNKKSIREEMNKLKEAQKEEIKTILFNCNHEKKNLADHISTLEDNVKSLKYENQRILQINDQNIKEAFNRLESEKCIIKRPLQSRIKKLEKEIEFVKKTKDNVEFQLNMANSEFENSLTKLKMNYEEKQKGLLPSELKQEYEETIGSLKSQVQILQQRTHLLQSELEDRNHLVNSSSCTASM